jgi:hypothetical protein
MSKRKTAPSAADPAFLALGRHKRAFGEFEAVADIEDEVKVEIEGREVTRRDRALYRVRDKAESKAFKALLETVPTTPAGVRAVIKWLMRHHGSGYDIGLMISYFETLLRSPVLADAESPGRAA